MTAGRLRRGATAEQIYAPRPAVQIGQIDSAFQSQVYIANLVRHDPHDVQAIVSAPKTSSDDESPPVDEGAWLFEQLRRLAQDLTCPLITNLQLECNRETCPEMKAGEWLYLCVAHGNNVGGHVQCCAIDYIVHTLDSATALLNSTRVFPSRLSVPPSSYRHFTSLARRLSRIFAHAFYHHRELFSQAEAESSLYARFLLLSQQHSLVPPELLVIPLESIQPGFVDEHPDPSGEYDYDRRPDSPQSAIELDEEPLFPEVARKKYAVQSRQLFDAGEPQDQDPDEPRDSAPIEHEPELAGQNIEDPPVTEVSNGADAPKDIQLSSAEEVDAPDDGAADALSQQTPAQSEPVEPNGHASPVEEPKPLDHTEDSSTVHEGESGSKEKDLDQEKEA